MKRLILILLLGIWFVPYACSSSAKDECGNCADLKINGNRKYLRYDLGINTIYIADGDSVCDVFVDRERRKVFSATCRKVPVLKWAFESMAGEVGTPELVPIEEYVPIWRWSQLALADDAGCLIIDSASATRPGYDCAVEEKISELKAFVAEVLLAIINANTLTEQ